MSIEAFMQGCFDAGYPVEVELAPSGVWRIVVHEGSYEYASRFRIAEGPSFDAAVDAINSMEWAQSTADWVAEHVIFPDEDPA